MDLHKFEGIKTVSEGDSLEVYQNVIPMGDRCMTIWGGDFFEASGKIIKTFKDSKGRLYFLHEDGIAEYNPLCEGFSMPLYERDGSISDFKVATGSMDIIESPIAENEKGDGYLFMRNTDWGRKNDASYMLAVLNDYSTNAKIIRFGQPNEMGEPDSSEVKSREEIHIRSMAWYDNRLLVYESSRSTLWISRTDPAWYLRPKIAGVDNNRFSASGGDQLWANWLKSSYTAESINKLLVYQGLLYVFYDSSVEVLSRTGNEDAPLSYVENLNTYNIGALDAEVISDKIFMLARNAGSLQIMVAARNSPPVRISNFEVERLLAMRSPKSLLCLKIQGLNFPAVELGRNEWLCCNVLEKSFLWFIYSLTPSGEAFYALQSADNNISIASGVAKSFVIRHKPELNAAYRHDTGERLYYLDRVVRDFPIDFPSRVILRSVEIVCDTGRAVDNVAKTALDKPMVYLRVSTDNGHTWGKTLTRELGGPGQNDKQIVFRNLGSGKSFLFEFGSSALQSFQVYKLRIEVA